VLLFAGASAVTLDAVVALQASFQIIYAAVIALLPRVA
jgi:hypothetical protein